MAKKLPGFVCHGHDKRLGSKDWTVTLDLYSPNAFGEIGFRILYFRIDVVMLG